MPQSLIRTPRTTIFVQGAKIVPRKLKAPLDL
jgi:hypothetical protein